MEAHGMQRRLSAIMCADVVGSSRLMAADEEGTLARGALGAPRGPKIPKPIAFLARSIG